MLQLGGNDLAYSLFQRFTLRGTLHVSGMLRITAFYIAFSITIFSITTLSITTLIRTILGIVCH